MMLVIGRPFLDDKVDDVDAFAIWSIEHNAWWKPNEWGYTANLTEAGLYTRTDVDRIRRGANLTGCNEAAIPWASLR